MALLLIEFAAMEQFGISMWEASADFDRCSAGSKGEDARIAEHFDHRNRLAGYRDAGQEHRCQQRSLCLLQGYATPLPTMLSLYG